MNIIFNNKLTKTIMQYYDFILMVISITCATLLIKYLHLLMNILIDLNIIRDISNINFINIRNNRIVKYINTKNRIKKQIKTIIKIHGAIIIIVLVPNKYESNSESTTYNIHYMINEYPDPPLLTIKPIKNELESEVDKTVIPKYEIITNKIPELEYIVIQTHYWVYSLTFENKLQRCYPVSFVVNNEILGKSELKICCKIKEDNSSYEVYI